MINVLETFKETYENFKKPICCNFFPRLTLAVQAKAADVTPVCTGSLTDKASKITTPVNDKQMTDLKDEDGHNNVVKSGNYVVTMIDVTEHKDQADIFLVRVSDLKKGTVGDYAKSQVLVSKHALPAGTYLQIDTNAEGYKLNLLCNGKAE